MIYKIFQIDMSDLYDEINSLGWEKAIAKYPQVAAQMEVSTLGAESYTPDMAEHYSLAQIVEAPGLEPCFAFCNGMQVDGAWEIHREAPHSLSVGDIVVACDKEGEEAYMVDTFGFKKIERAAKTA